MSTKMNDEILEAHQDNCTHDEDLNSTCPHTEKEILEMAEDQSSSQIRAEVEQENLNA